MLYSTFIFPWVLLWANVYDGFWECNTMAIEKQTESGNKTKVTCIRSATLKRTSPKSENTVSIFSSFQPWLFYGTTQNIFDFQNMISGCISISMDYSMEYLVIC